MTIVMRTEKACSRCREVKPLTGFHVSRRNADGHNNYCKVCNTAYMRQRYRELEAPVVRARNLMKYYGLTVEDYERLLASQGGRCAICRNLPDRPGYLHVDHCHATGRVRGILCAKCNWALGNADDSPERLRAMADYLEGF